MLAKNMVFQFFNFQVPAVILGDAYDSSRIIDIASDADVVVHEAPLENELMVKCIDHGHSTPGSYL